MSLMEKYAFRGQCELTEIADEVTVYGPCHYCSAPQSVTVKKADLEKFRAGNYAQDCFQGLSPGQREFLISGICDKCWDDMFAGDEDDE